MDQSWHKNSLKGQSLVEMAIALPLLIFILIGVFEVGYILRNYLIILNASREGARFATRPFYINPDEFNETIDPIITHVISSSNLRLEKIIITYIDIKAQTPCNLSQENWQTKCDCELARSTPYTATVYSYPTTSSIKSAYNLDKLADQLSIENNYHNCEILKTGMPFLPYQVVVSEVIYDHEQLFGFPFISNPYTDPVELRASTIMRVNRLRLRWERALDERN